MHYFLIAGSALFLLILIFMLTLLRGGNRVTDWLTRPVRAWLVARYNHTLPPYAYQALVLRDRLERGDISEEEYAKKNMRLASDKCHAYK